MIVVVVRHRLPQLVDFSYASPPILPPILLALNRSSSRSPPRLPPPSSWRARLQSLVRLAIEPLLIRHLPLPFRFQKSVRPSVRSNMDAPDRSSSPRSRQLQGPRPPRLAVSKDSHKVRKPPIAPQQRHQLQTAAPATQQYQQYNHHQQYQHHHHQPPQQQARAPVIIYDASPKVIHTKPGDFMALVQRLTGPGSGAPPAAPAQFDASMAPGPSSAAPPPQQHQQPPEFQPREFLLSPTAALSPAARLAAIERSVRPGLPPPAYSYNNVVPDLDPDDSMSMAVDFDSFAALLGGPSASASRPGILSPAALPPAASTGLFSPMPFDPSSHAWLADLSPFLPSARQPGMVDPPFAPSPRSNLLATPTMPSPATFSVLEFFSTYPDL